MSKNTLTRDCRQIALRTFCAEETKEREKMQPPKNAQIRSSKHFRKTLEQMSRCRANDIAIDTTGLFSY
jgi:hypothetical protein